MCVVGSYFKERPAIFTALIYFAMDLAFKLLPGVLSI